MGILPHHGVHPVVHSTAFVAEGAWIIGEVTVDEQSSIWFNAVLRGDINLIRVGKRSNIQDGCLLHVTSALPVVVGDDVTVGHKATLHGCLIGNAVLVGMDAVVLDNVRVEPFSIVAAGSLVKENFVVPEGTLVAGVPARIVRDLREEEKEFLLQSAKNYIAYAQSYKT